MKRIMQSVVLLAFVASGSAFARGGANGGNHGGNHGSGPSGGNGGKLGPASETYGDRWPHYGARVPNAPGVSCNPNIWSACAR